MINASSIAIGQINFGFSMGLVNHTGTFKRVNEMTTFGFESKQTSEKQPKFDCDVSGCICLQHQTFNITQ